MERGRTYLRARRSRSSMIARCLPVVVAVLAATTNAAAARRSLLSDTDTTTATLVDLPDAIVATWVVLSPEGTPPAARCDHMLQSLEGRVNQPSALFPNLTTTTPDPWAGTFWLFGGHGYDSSVYNESWLLNVNLDPPTWTQLNYSADSDTLAPRFAAPVGILPDGLDARDEGLTILIYGGVDNNVYMDDLISLNLNTNTVRSIVNDSTSVSSDKPFARGYSQWAQLPSGFGTGNMSSTANGSGTFFLMGGLGASDGVRYSDTDKDWDDEWTLNLADLAWSRFGEFECLANTTVCQGQQPLYSYASALADAYAASSLDTTADISPSAAYAALQALLVTIQDVGTGLGADLANMTTNSTEFIDPTNACTTSCSLPSLVSTGDLVYPPVLEGHRMAVVANVLFMFGGYMCTAAGEQNLGGDTCYSSSVWALDLATMIWTEHVEPTSDSRYANFASYWPSARAYGIVAAQPDKKLVIFQGGAYQDSTAVWYYYNDAYAFDTTLRQFVPFTIKGVPPVVGWSSAAAINGDDIVLFGGCAGDSFTNQLLSLRLDLAIEASNCLASGTSLTTATAGVQASFLIQTHESTSTSNGTVTTIVWGKNATYGSGLSFTAQLVTASSTTGQALGLVLAKVTDMTLGLYKVTYTLTVGTDYKLFVYLDDDQIPNSPFSVSLKPRALANSSMSTASGVGVFLAEKSKTATAVVLFVDLYGNSLTDDRFLLDYTNAAALAAMEASQTWFGSDNASFVITAELGATGDAMASIPIKLVNNNNGSFSLTYDVPSDASTFLLAISLNNVSLSGSPFTVTGLNSIELPYGWTTAFWVLSFLVIGLCIALSAAVHHNRMEPLMRTASPNFLQLLILGSVLTSISVIFLTLESSSGACRAFHTLLSVGLVISVSALLAKSHRVMRIFTASKLKVKAGLGDAHLMIPTGIVVGIMLLLNLLWIGIEPLNSESRPAVTYPEVLSYSSCQGGPNMIVYLALILAYVGVILIYGVYLAVRTGSVPAEFNESKLIAAAVYNVAFCTIIVVPLLFFIGASSDLMLGRFVIEATVILWCSVFNVAAVIGPKLLQLKLAPMTTGTMYMTATAPLSNLLSQTPKTASQLGIDPALKRLSLSQLPDHPASPQPGKRMSVIVPLGGSTGDVLSGVNPASSPRLASPSNGPIKRPTPRPSFVTAKPNGRVSSEDFTSAHAAAAPSTRAPSTSIPSSMLTSVAEAPVSVGNEEPRQPAAGRPTAPTLVVPSLELSSVPAVVPAAAAVVAFVPSTPSSVSASFNLVEYTPLSIIPRAASLTAISPLSSPASTTRRILRVHLANPESVHAAQFL